MLAKSVGRLVIAGELGDGSVRAISGVLPAVLWKPKLKSATVLKLGTFAVFGLVSSTTSP